MWFWAYFDEEGEITVHGFGVSEQEACVQAASSSQPDCTLYIGHLDKYDVLVTIRREAT